MRWTWRTSCRCHQVRGGDGDPRVGASPASDRTTAEGVLPVSHVAGLVAGRAGACVDGHRPEPPLPGGWAASRCPAGDTISVQKF